MRKIAAILTLIILSLLPATGLAERQDSIVVSLLTAWPGADIYQLCGHEAVRIRSIGSGVPAIDSVWNYGIFDFQQPHFVYRFVKGETDYMVGAYPMAYFMQEYVMEKRRVLEQDLNLSQQEAHKLLAMLREESKPENRTYRYNYVRDNCATRIIDRLDAATDERIVYPDTVVYGTFRDEMRAFHKDYPWYQFGIDLALGSGIDYPVRGREEMFTPVEMARRAEGAHFADGRPLVTATRVLNEGVPDATLGPTHWSATPIFCCSIFLLIVLVLCWWQYRRKVIYRAVYSVWFGLLGLAGLLITFLVFISSHEATSPNILIFWLNPLQLLIAAGVWLRRSMRFPTYIMIYYNIVILTVLLIIWPWQAQSANPAFFPLMGATLAMAATYALTGPKVKTERNEEVGNLGANRSCGARRRSTGGSRKTAARGRNRR